MCDNLLIDLTGWNEPVKEETVVEEPALVEANSFKGPYDPFDSVEKEACLMALKLPIKTEIPEIEKQDFDQDLNNEPPPDALELDESDLKSPETRLAKPNAALCHNSPPHNSIKLFRDVMLDSLQMIAAESPIKFVEDEPQQVPISITGPTDYECSNAEFEERLKNLRIAMSGTVMEKPASTTLEINTEQVVRKANRVNVDRSTHGGYVEELLILKSLVCQHVEVSKRKEFDLVIERLRNIFNVLTSSAEATKQQPAVDSPQASYTRQATFDMQLQQQQQKETAECVAGLGAGRKVDAFPDAMTCSSATYDGESVATVPLPIIDSEKPKALPEICVQKPDSYTTNQVNENLMLQINELLERHNLQTNEEHQLKQECDHNNETKTGGSASTVILIVNSTASSNQIPSCIVHPTTNTTITPAPVVVAPVAPAASGSSAASSRTSTYRRRSSSLSIHDKAKPAERTKPFVNQNVPPKELLTVDNGNAMKSFRQRRNSYSLHSTAAKAGAGASLGVVKSAAINESTTPTKAGIPTKRVVPRVKPLNVSTAANSHHLNTPMPSKTKPAGGQMFCTSTPMPQMRAQPRRSLRPVSSYSNVSTSIQSSYSKRPSQ